MLGVNNKGLCAPDSKHNYFSIHFSDSHNLALLMYVDIKSNTSNYVRPSGHAFLCMYVCDDGSVLASRM